MNSKNHTFDFTVPQGPTGPQGIQGLAGPTGPTGIFAGLNAYGGRYSTFVEVLNLGTSSPVQVPLLDISVLRNVDYSTLSSITIQEPGVYEINYVLNASTSSATTLTVAVRANGNDISGTKNAKNVPSQTNTTFCGTIFFTLKKGEVIDLAIS